MQKEKVLSSLFVAMFSIVAFAAPKKDAVISADQSPSVSTPPVEQTPLWEILIWALVAVIVIGVVVWIGYTIYCKFVEHFENLNNLKSNISAFLQRQNSFSNSRSDGSQTANLISQSESRLYNATVQYCDEKANQLYANIHASISSAVAPISESLSSNALVATLAKCSEQTVDIQTKLDSFLAVAPKIAEMNEQMQKLISEKPELVNLSIDTAVELVKQCQLEGISTAAQVKEVTTVFNKCKELQFASVTELAESKKYYDARVAHADAIDELQKTINGLEEERGTLRQELNLLKQKQMSVAEESVRIKQANDSLSAKNAELVQNLAHVEAERNRLSAAMKSLCPDDVKADSLINLLKDTLPELRAETLALVVQLYWFARLSRNTPNKIKAAFTKFDETLYELFSEEQELLQSIRQSIQSFVNTEVFKGTSYEVSWPLLNSSASKHEDHYNRENDEGNRICKVRSAVIINAGSVESVARIYTSL